MDSIIHQIGSFISSSKDKRLVKKLLSIEKKLKKEKKRLKQKIRKIDEISNPIETREENKFRVKNIGYKTIEEFLKGVKKKY